MNINGGLPVRPLNPVFMTGGGLCFQLRSWRVNGGAEPHELRFFVSHFLRR
jgi:hypothetical protein